MKLLKAIAYAALTGAFFVASTGVALAAPQAWEITHRDSTDMADVTTDLAPPSIDSRSSYLPYFLGNDDGVDGTFGYYAIGSGIGTTSNQLYVTPSTIETPQGHLTDTLNGLVSTSTLNLYVNSIQAQIGALGPAVNIAAFMGNAGSTTPFIATSTFTGFMSGAMVTKLAALSTTTPRSMASTTVSIVTGTGATGTQVSSSRDAQVSYSGTITTTANITGGAQGTLVLEEAPTNSATASDWSEVGRCTDGQSFSLAVAIQGIQTIGCELSGYVPAGWYERIRSISTTGTPTFVVNSGQQVLLS